MVHISQKSPVHGVYKEPHIVYYVLHDKDYEETLLLVKVLAVTTLPTNVYLAFTVIILQYHKLY